MSRSGVVALAFDQASHSLFKAGAAGAFRSSDGGRHWAPLSLRQASNTLTSIAVSAGGKGVLYIAGSTIGVQRSDDGGRTWSARNIGLPGTDVTALATHADRSETVYTYITGRGIFRSEDGGRRWRLMDAGPRGGITHFIHSNMPGSMQTGWVFAATALGIQRSMDCFCGWRDAGQVGRTVRNVAYDPHQPSKVYAATDAGVIESADGGESWMPLEPPVIAADALVVTGDGMLYAASSDGKLWRRNARTAVWERPDA